MYYFDLYATRECNLKCGYCAQDRSKSRKASYDMGCLKRYLSEFEGEKCIVFYGGEPLLNMDFIRKTHDFFVGDGVKFGVQTNGTLLNALSSDELLMFDMVMVSVDGYEEVHDSLRGRGTFRSVLSNIKRIEKPVKAYARLTVSDAAKYADYAIMGLLNCFDGVFWQTCDKEYPPNCYEAFSEEYNRQVGRVIDFWHSGLEAGIVMSFPIFNLIYRDVVTGRKHDAVRCGANSTHITIDTDGSVYPCVDSVFYPEYRIGHISDCPGGRRHPFPVSCDACARCAPCPVKDICGGACWMDMNDNGTDPKYVHVKCSNIISVIRRIETYARADGGRHLAAVERDIMQNKLFYGYCEEIP